jgi:O-antigen ligase
MFGSVLGISVPFIAGGMLPVLAAFCIIRLGWRATAVYAPLKLPLVFTMSYLVVQITFHDASIMQENAFFTWILALIIIQSLCLRRGFLHRCALVLFVVGLITLPYLTFKGSAAGGREQAAVSAMVTGAFTNSNSFGAWFGFCCLYFTIVALETKRVGVQMASSLAAVGCLYIVGLTVSRGTLVATAIGITIALRGLLKRGFVPLLVFIILGGIMYNFGVFDRITSHYATRGTEDTGRLLVWPVAIERFLSSPLLGVGTANTATYVPGHRKPFAPHNSFIFVALSSGVLPFALFVAWWIRAVQNAFSYSERLADGPFRLPLLVYTFVITLVSDFPFMAPWGLLTFAVAMASSTPSRARRLIAVRDKALDGSTLWTPRRS